MPGRGLVAGGGQVAEDEVVLGKLRVDERLQKAVVLHPVRKGIADAGDVVAPVEREVLRAERIQAKQAEPDHKKSQFFHRPEPQDSALHCLI